jgi:hypothetical protein
VESAERELVQAGIIEAPRLTTEDPDTGNESNAQAGLKAADED